MRALLKGTSTIAAHTMTCLVCLTAVGHAETVRELSGSEIRKALAGRTMVIERHEVVVDSAAGSRLVRQKYPVRYYAEMRDDGSYTVKCTVREPGWEHPCRGDSRFIGVWETKGNQFCNATLGVRSERRACFTVTQSSATRLYFSQSNAAEVVSNLAGPVDLR